MFLHKFCPALVRDRAVRSVLTSGMVHAGAIVSLALAATVVEHRLVGEPVLEVRVTEQAARPEPISMNLTQSFAPLEAGSTRLAETVDSWTAARLDVEAPRLVPAPDSPGGGLLASLEEGKKKLDDGISSDTATFYGIDASGNSFVFVVDRSGSMQGSRFRRARVELTRSIRSLADSQRFFVIFFSSAANPMPARRPLFASTKNVRRAARWIGGVGCQGNTLPDSALLLALEFQPDAIFFLTDGEFSPSAAAVVRQPGRNPAIPIHTIGFVNRASEPLLRKISGQTGGKYRFVP